MDNMNIRVFFADGNYAIERVWAVAISLERSESNWLAWSKKARTVRHKSFMELVFNVEHTHAYSQHLGANSKTGVLLIVSSFL